MTTETLSGSNPTLNLPGVNDVTLVGTPYGDTINSTGVNTINAAAYPSPNWFESEGTNTLNINGILQVNGTLDQFELDTHGGLLANNGTIEASWANIDSTVLGNGTFEFLPWHDGPGSHVLNSFSGPGLTYDVDSNLTIDNPHTFFSKVNFIGGWPESQIDLAGLAATSYDFKNDQLTLYQGNAAVYQLRLSDPNGDNFVVSNYSGYGGGPGGVSLTIPVQGQHLTGLPQHTVGV